MMIKMPWNNLTAPNFMLEITDVCNIECRTCYKKAGTTFKSLSQVKQDLEDGMKLRQLHTITISGGEPTLHPDLCRIIEMIKGYGLHVFLLTNGLLINDHYMEKLQASGLDSILFHVDVGQKRPDLPDPPVFEDVQKRLGELIQIARVFDIDISMSVTLYEDAEHILANSSKFFFETSDLTFLFIAKATCTKDLLCTPTSGHEPSRLTYSVTKTYLNKTIHFFKDIYGLEPFSFIPTTEKESTVWISYFVPIIYKPGGNIFFQIRSNLLDSWLMEIPRLLSGSYIHKTKQNVVSTLIRTFVNSVASFQVHRFLKFMFQLLSPSAKLRHKMIVYDNGPFIGDDGKLIHCEYCPTAILRDGNLVTCCTTDVNQ